MPNSAKYLFESDLVIDSQTTQQDQGRIVAEQTRLLYATLPLTFLAHLILAALVLWITPESVGSSAQLTWAVLVACMLLARLGLYVLYRHKTPASTTQTIQWRQYFRIGVGLGGAVWGLTAYFLFPSEALVHQVFLAFVLAGISAGAATSLTPDLKSVMLFIGLTLLPLLTRFFLEGTQMAIAMGIMVIAFLVFIGTNARRVAKAFKENLTLRIEAEIRDAALLAAKEEAERANLAKSRFLSSMSHELRTPMNAVIGFAQLLELDNNLSADQKLQVQSIHKAGNHLLKLINEVLDLSRIEAGRADLSIEPVEIHSLIQDSIGLLKPLADQHDIELNIATPETPGFWVLADRTRLKQVAINLISNAIKYNHQHGKVHIGIQAVGTNRVRLSVADNGPGIPVERQAELFTMFNRLGTENRMVEGTGIGLAVAKRLIEMMDGTIGLVSVPDQGSTFWIELPLAAS